jgi:predicted RNA-binding protein with RPS1 domain
MYDDGYNGSSLKPNKSIKTSNSTTVVYSHEPYAAEVFEKYESYLNGAYTAKDATKGSVYSIVDVHTVSDHELAIDTNNGMSAVIDLNKEKQFLEAIGCDSIDKFAKAVSLSDDYKKELLESNLMAKVVNGGRISLWEGHLSKIEAEFMEQIKHPENATVAYKANIKEINGGGYIVDIMGIRCFLPGSLAAAGILTDFSALLGKTIPVMIVNYLPKSGFIVSYKKYLNYILPFKIDEELSVGMEVSTKVTGTSKNGIFLQFKDKNGEWVFSGLIHRSSMSKDFEKRFDKKEFVIGDEMKAYITEIIVKDGQSRIILSDHYGNPAEDSSNNEQ